MKVYLCGSIAGCTDEECKDWREYVKKELGAENCLDPMRRDYRGCTDTSVYPEIVDGDKVDILSSDIVLVYFTGPSVGTIMEILFAWMNHRTVYLVYPFDQTTMSPWLFHHTTVRFTKIEDAVRRIKVIKSTTL